MQFSSETTKTVKTVGDIENNKVSIDTKNIDFIITILSTNLYSSPINSFIRETVSNAWDSHVEAGVDKPVVIEIYTNTEGQHFCKIQDFGVGISEERFNNIYRNIGSSTKREDNSQIGGFGIGRFSALAYSDVVIIESNYNGENFKYQMYKDGNSISIDLLYKGTTNNPNGVSVTIPIKSSIDVENFIDAIREQLSFFENLYVDVSNYDNTSYNFNDISNRIEIFNKSVIKRFNNFSINTSKNPASGIKLLLGKVVYPLSFSELPVVPDTNIQTWGIALQFDIGELEVTPNREQVLYSSKNIDIISKKLNLAIEEVNEMVKNKSLNYESLSEYYTAISSKPKIDILEGVNIEDKYELLLQSDAKHLYTYKGKTYNTKVFKDLYDLITTKVVVNTPIYSIDSSNNKIHLSSNRVFSFNTLKDSFKHIVQAKYYELNNYSKAYLKEKTDYLFIFPVYTLTDLKKSISQFKTKIEKDIEDSNKYTLSNHKRVFDEKIFNLILKSFLKNLVKIPVFSNNSVPQSFIDDKKALQKLNKNKTTVDWNENISINIMRTSNVGYLNSVAESKTLLKKDLDKDYKKKVVIYSDKTPINKEFRLFVDLIRFNSRFSGRYDTIEVASTKQKFLKDLNNFHKYEDFMKQKNKVSRDIATALLLKKEIPHLNSLSRISNLDKISVPLSVAVKELNNFVESVLGNVYSNSRHSPIIDRLVKEIEEQVSKTRNYNYKYLGLYNQFKKQIHFCKFIINLREQNYRSNIKEELIPFIIDYVIARKAFIPNLKTLNEIKNETNKN